MPNPKLSLAVASETIAALEQHGSQVQAAKALGVSRSTFQTRLRRALQYEDADRVQAILHEQRFMELKINHGTLLVCSDVHCWPGDFSAGQRAFIWFTRYLRPDYIVINGDLFDGAGISRFPKNNWNQIPSVAKELEACLRFTGALTEASPSSRRIIVPGNHDERFMRRLLSEAPEFCGVHGFDIRDHFPNWEWVYRVTINAGSDGMTDILHNWANGIHSGYNNVMRSGINYCTGHTHRLLIRPMNDRRGVRWGVETGTLAGTDHPSAYYTAGRPVDWHPGFVLLTYHDGLLLRPEQIDVLPEGRVAFRGAVSEIPEFS